MRCPRERQTSSFAIVICKSLADGNHCAESPVVESLGENFVCGREAVGDERPREKFPDPHTHRAPSAQPRTQCVSPSTVEPLPLTVPSSVQDKHEGGRTTLNPQKPSAQVLASYNVQPIKKGSLCTANICAGSIIEPWAVPLSVAGEIGPHTRIADCASRL